MLIKAAFPPSPPGSSQASATDNDGAAPSLTERLV